MGLTAPSTLSPSKLTSFMACGLQFRFSAIDGLPEAPSPAAARGTLVHAALERLFLLPSAERTLAAAFACLDDAHDAYRPDPEWVGLHLTDEQEAAMLDESAELIERYFALEDPTAVHPVGLELMLSTTIGDVTLRGIIDRLELVDGELVVTDYKTGRSPSDEFARAHMLGVHVYSYLVEQNFGRRPARVQLLHLAEPVAVIAEPTDESTRGLHRRMLAVWEAVQQACDEESFAPRPSGRCDWCSYQRWCPAFGGDPSRAVVDVEIARRSAAGQDPLFV